MKLSDSFGCLFFGLLIVLVVLQLAVSVTSPVAIEAPVIEFERDIVQLIVAVFFVGLVLNVVWQLIVNLFKGPSKADLLLKAMEVSEKRPEFQASEPLYIQNLENVVEGK